MSDADDVVPTVDLLLGCCVFNHGGRLFELLSLFHFVFFCFGDVVVCIWYREINSDFNESKNLIRKQMSIS